MRRCIQCIVLCVFLATPSFLGCSSDKQKREEQPAPVHPEATLRLADSRGRGDQSVATWCDDKHQDAIRLGNDTFGHIEFGATWGDQRNCELCVDSGETVAHYETTDFNPHLGPLDLGTRHIRGYCKCTDQGNAISVVNVDLEPAVSAALSVIPGGQFVLDRLRDAGQNLDLDASIFSVPGRVWRKVGDTGSCVNLQDLCRTSSEADFNNMNGFSIPELPAEILLNYNQKYTAICGQLECLVSSPTSGMSTTARCDAYGTTPCINQLAGGNQSTAFDYRDTCRADPSHWDFATHRTTTATNDTAPPPACGSGLMCDVTAVTGGTTCTAGTGVVAYCCPAGHNLNEGRTACVSPGGVTAEAVPPCGAGLFCAYSNVDPDATTCDPGGGNPSWKCCPYGQGLNSAQTGCVAGTSGQTDDQQGSDLTSDATTVSSVADSQYLCPSGAKKIYAPCNLNNSAQPQGCDGSGPLSCIACAGQSFGVCTLDGDGQRAIIAGATYTTPAYLDEAVCTALAGSYRPYDSVLGKLAETLFGTNTTANRNKIDPCNPTNPRK